MKKKQGLVDAISDKLFDEFQLAIALPADQQKKLQHKKKVTKDDFAVMSEAALDKFYRVVDAERSRHRLGVIGKARVAFGLQQRLLKAGYAVPLVKQVLLAMLASAFVGKRR